MSDYSDPDDYDNFYAYGDWWNPFDSPDDYDDYLFYDGYDDSYDDCDYDDTSESDCKDEDLAAYMAHLTSSEYELFHVTPIHPLWKIYGVIPCQFTQRIKPHPFKFAQIWFVG